MKIVFFLLIIWATNACSTKIDVNILSDQELANLPEGPDEEPLDYSLFTYREMILGANDIRNQVNYVYKCEGLPINTVLEFVIVKSQSRDKSNQNISLTENGLLVNSSCSTPLKFTDENFKKMYLRECAKSSAMALVSSGLFNVVPYDNAVDYVQWCIVEETKDNVEIMEFIKLEDKLDNHESFEGLRSPCFENREDEDCK